MIALPASPRLSLRRSRSRFRSWSRTIALLFFGSLPGSGARCEEGSPWGPVRFNRVVFLGNSITLHAPAPQLGWDGNWGMAASCREKDYVHLLVQRIAQSTGTSPAVLVKNIGEFERNLGEHGIEAELADVGRFEADLIIVAIGENCPTPTTEPDRQRFSKAMNRLIGYLKTAGHPTILVRSQFWPEKIKERLLQQVAENQDVIWVDLGSIGTDRSNFAQAERKFENEAVGIHPGDKGMAAIADRLWKAIREQRPVKRN